MHSPRFFSWPAHKRSKSLVDMVPSGFYLTGCPGNDSVTNHPHTKEEQITRGSLLKLYFFSLYIQMGSSPRSSSSQQQRRGNHYHSNQQQDLMMMSSPQHHQHQSRSSNHRGGRLPIGSKSPSASSQSEPSYPDGMEPYSTLSGKFILFKKEKKDYFSIRFGSIILSKLGRLLLMILDRTYRRWRVREKLHFD